MKWCPVCRHRHEGQCCRTCGRWMPPTAPDAPVSVTLNGHIKSSLRLLAAEFDELSGQDRWRAVDFVEWMLAGEHVPSGVYEDYSGIKNASSAWPPVVGVEIPGRHR